MRFSRVLGLLAVGVAVSAACSSDDETTGPGTSGDASADGALGDASGSTAGTANTGGVSGTAGSTGTGGGLATAGTSGTDGNILDGGPQRDADTCIGFAEYCTYGGMCCSGLCDGSNNTCASSTQGGGDPGAGCTGPTDCESLSCIDGSCASSGSCTSDGDVCTSNDECCGNSCTDGSCAPLNNSCSTSGNSCSDNGNCCSGSCVENECDWSPSFCIQPGDICSNSTQCCSGTCTLSADGGAGVGTCAEAPTGSASCNDGVEGTLCNSCGDCCSRLCAPYGPSGVDICQPASGCHVMGELCRDNTDCCGGGGTGLPGEYLVGCDKDDDAEIGICRSATASADGGNACQPQGYVCHMQDYTCPNSSAPNNCCAGQGNYKACKLDPLGVPRCDGLGDNCREGGETCASASDCCQDVPCVEGDDGFLRCLSVPDGGVIVCVESGKNCTINADCCRGTTCVRPVGSTNGTCSTPTDPPPPTDGGTPTWDGGLLPDGAPAPDGSSPRDPPTYPPTCGEYGQNCDVDSDCCNDIPCTAGSCRFPVQ
ncbi:MAG: hypothetical protein HRU17_08890 [Polyangiaceae bacterium]|nr:hypothetical protein [Polyangiaceae bacterium]